jgi:hypothetical protein
MTTSMNAEIGDVTDRNQPRPRLRADRGLSLDPPINFALTGVSE